MKLFNRRTILTCSPVILLLLIAFIFYFKAFLQGSVPFPGDLLLSTYAPWRHESYAGYNAGSIPTKGQYFDVVREIYPWKTLVVKQLKAGLIPLWNPYNFSGAPLLANVQSQALYPYSVVYFFLTQVDAWTFMIVLQSVLGLFFMYMFAVEIGLSRSAALLSAVLFNFSSFAKVWIEFNTIWHTVLWLPLLLYLFERGLKLKRLSFFQQTIFVIALVSSATGGHPQDFLYILIFLVVYIIFRIFSGHSMTWKERTVALLYPNLTLLLFGLAIASPLLMPTADLFGNSARVAHDYAFIINNLLLQWWQIAMLVVPDIYGNPATKTEMFGDYIIKAFSIGSVGFFLSLISVLYAKQSWYKRFFFMTAVLVFLITVNSPVTQFIYKFPIPILSTGTPTRIHLLLEFALSVLAGLGFDAFIRLKKPPYKGLVAMIAVLGLLWGLAIVRPPLNGLTYGPDSFSVMKRALILPSAFFLSLALIGFFGRRVRVLYLFVIVIAVLEQFQAFQKFNSFVPKNFVYPDNKVNSFLRDKTGIFRSWGYGTARIEANFGTQEGFYSTDGTDPLNLKWYNQLVQASKDGNIALAFNIRTRNDAQIQPGYGTDELPANQYRLRLLDLLGVKFVLDRDENPKDNGTFPPDRFAPVWREDSWTIYENKYVAPRIFLSSDIRLYKSIHEFESMLFADDFNPSKTVLLDAQNASPPVLIPGKGDIKIDIYSPSEIRLTVHSDTQQLLFLSDAYDAGWNAFVNGQKTNIYRADFAFRGIVVPGGDSAVRFYYLPQAFVRGVQVSAGGIMLFFLLNGVQSVYMRSKKVSTAVENRV